jgi:hypothetical protein
MAHSESGGTKGDNIERIGLCLDELDLPNVVARSKGGMSRNTASECAYETDPQRYACNP